MNPNEDVMDILVIEDDPTDLKLFSAVLRDSGHHVLAKASADEAAAAIKARRPGIVLIDLKLPGMDGLELTRLLKQDPETQHIPIVAVTAAPEKFRRDEAMKAGCDAYIVKPIDTRRLSEQLAAVAAKPSQ